MLSILAARRSVRAFTPEPIPAAALETLQEAVLRAPTSRNNQPCQFIFIDDKTLIEKLAASKAHGTAFMKSARLALVIVADPQASDVWIEDSAIAAIIAQLTAESLGLKSCWGQLRLRPHDENRSAADYLRELLGIPAELEVPIILGLGYPQQALAGHARETLAWHKLHHNRY